MVLAAARKPEENLPALNLSEPRVRVGQPILISPSLDPEYQTFYLQGFEHAFPSRGVRFSSAPFRGLPWGFLGIVDPVSGRRVCIDTLDASAVNERWLAWCDVYGKVNFGPDGYPGEGGAKVVPIGPNFAVRYLGRARSLVNALLVLSLDRAPDRSARRTLSRWRRQYLYHLPEASFAPGKVTPGYVYFTASLWPGEPECNELRLAFIRACKQIDGIEFEGGFAPFVHGFEGPTAQFAEHLLSSRVTTAEWIAKLQRSLVAFVTPGVHRCLTWRLGQALALGKAIVATPVRNRMPEPLVHGESAHFVEPDQEAMRAAVARIAADPSYRERLERGARDYYARWLAPRRVVERLLAPESG